MFRNFFLLIMIMALIGCTAADINSNTVYTGTVGENEPITRAEAARMVSLNRYTLEEINNMERVISFEDTDISKWYDKYINAAYNAGFIAGVDEEHFAPDEYLTLRQSQFLLDKLKADNKIKLQYAQEDKDKPIPYNIWVSAFEKDMNTDKLETVNIKIYADKTQCKMLGDNFYITDLGVTYYEGYESLASDSEICAVVNANAIAALKSVSNIDEYKGLEVVERGDKYISVKVPGGVRRFEGENNVNVGDIVNIQIENGVYKIIRE